VKARARIVAVPDGRGGTRLAVLRGESPLLLRRTGPPQPEVRQEGPPQPEVRQEGPRGGTTVHLVGGAAGPLRGDDLRLEIEVEAGAELTVRSVAAQLALPGRDGLPPSVLEIHAVAGPGATLRWLPEPMIAAAGCDHRTITDVEVAEGGRLLWRDELVCGRHGEPSGSVQINTTVRYAGKTVYRHDLAVGPHAPGWSAAAVLGGARAIGTLVALPELPGPLPPVGPDFAAMPLSGPGTVVTVLGADIRTVKAALDRWSASEPGVLTAAVAPG
jgi:urease accessory protein